MKIFVPTPTEAGRVKPFDVTRNPSDTGYCDRNGNQFWDHRHGHEWFSLEGPALYAANAATRRRIASLEKQIAKLKGFLGEAGDA